MHKRDIHSEVTAVDLSHAATRQELRRLARQYDAYVGQLTDTQGHGLDVWTYWHANEVAEALRSAALHIEDLERAEQERNERAERERIANERDQQEDAEYLRLKNQRGSVSLPLLALQAAAGIGIASGVAAVIQWAQAAIGGAL